MNKEDLKKLGIEDEAVQKKIIVLHGKDIEKLKATNETAKVDAEAAKVEIEGLQNQVKEAGVTIDGFKNMDVESVKKSADEWKLKAEQAGIDAKEQIGKIRTDGEKQVSDLKFDHAVEGALLKAKAKNPKAVRALLKTENLKLNEDGTLLGLDEQLKGIVAENDYLFETDEDTPGFVKGTKTDGVLGDAVTNAAREAAGLPAEQE